VRLLLPREEPRDAEAAESVGRHGLEARRLGIDRDEDALVRGERGAVGPDDAPVDGAAREEPHLEAAREVLLGEREGQRLRGRRRPGGADAEEAIARRLGEGKRGPGREPANGSDAGLVRLLVGPVGLFEGRDGHVGSCDGPAARIVEDAQDERSRLRQLEDRLDGPVRRDLDLDLGRDGRADGGPHGVATRRERDRPAAPLGIAADPDLAERRPPARP
jgi:hypothetical protein